MTKLFSKHPNRSPLSPSLEGRVGVGLLLFLTLLCACGGKPKDAKSVTDLVADADHFQVDTIVADPADTLVSTSADHVLRHYPELYKAVAKAQKIFGKWALQEQQTALKTDPSLLDIRSIVTETLTGTSMPPTDQLAQLTLLTDSIGNAYLPIISDAPADHKTAIGHSRKAFLAYAEQLQSVRDAVPTDLRERYDAILFQLLQQHLQKLTTDN